MNGISVCLATHESRSVNLQMSLFSIQNQSYSGPLEIVIIDDNSQTNIIEETIKGFNLDINYQKIFFDSHFNLAACRNIAVSKAKYDIVIGFDSDMIYDKNLLSTVYETHTQDFNIHNDYSCVIPWRNVFTIFWIDPFGFLGNGVCDYSSEKIELLKQKIITDTVKTCNIHDIELRTALFMEYSSRYNDNSPRVAISDKCYQYLSEIEKEHLLRYIGPDNLHHYGENIFDFSWYCPTVGVCSYWKNFLQENKPWEDAAGYYAGSSHIGPKLKGIPRIYVPLVDKVYHIRHSNDCAGRK